MANKRIAVVVADRQGEALRMSLGLLLLGDVVDVYVLGRELERTEATALHLETINEMEMKLYTDREQPEGMDYVATEEAARGLTEYDHVLRY